MANWKVCVVGLGYIGLPTATVLAIHGHDVIGVDLNQRAVDSINAGHAHIIEPDLNEAVRDAVTSGRLKAQTTPVEADFYCLCVPTPFHKREGIPDPDMTYVMAAAESIAPYLRDGSTVILESTSPVGSTEAVAELLKAKAPGVNFNIAYCPERVLPGKILKELIENDRIVGGLTPEATQKVAALYATFVKGEVLKTNARTAEMAKLTENSFRDVNIAFANELSLICERMGIDVWELIALANHHPRVNILQPGCGVGGHCIAVDPWFIVSAAPDLAKLIESARRVNDHKPHWVVDQVETRAKQIRNAGKEPVVACLGLAYKPDIDDFRESPALEVAHLLRNRGLNTVAVEPFAEEGVHDLGVKLIELTDALQTADIFVGLVSHSIFKTTSFDPARMMDFCGLARKK